MVLKVSVVQVPAFFSVGRWVRWPVSAESPVLPPETKMWAGSRWAAMIVIDRGITPING